MPVVVKGDGGDLRRAIGERLTDDSLSTRLLLGLVGRSVSSFWVACAQLRESTFHRTTVILLSGRSAPGMFMESDIQNTNVPKTKKENVSQSIS